MNNESILTVEFPGNQTLQKSVSHLCEQLSKAQGHLAAHLQSEVVSLLHKLGPAYHSMLHQRETTQTLEMHGDADLKWAGQKPTVES